MLRARWAVTLGLAISGLIVAGCGSSGGSGGGGGTTTAAFVARRAANVNGDLPPADRKLWHYATASARYEAVPGSAESFPPHLEKPAKTFTLAYIDPWAANPFAIPIRTGVQKYAKELGLNLIYCDAENKPEKAVECSTLLARQHPAFAIAGNWQSGASNAMIKVWNEAHVPTASIDVWQPNSIFFGADNYTAGNLGGKAAGEYAKSTWGCKDLWIFMGENKAEGEAAAQRLAGFSDGIQEVCGKLSSERIQTEVMAEGTSSQAIDITTAWLTAHPQAKHVLATSIDDERASGIAKVFKQNSIPGMAVGLGCDTVGQKVTLEAPASVNHYLGCVAFFPEHYAEYLVSIALAVVAGKPVPQEVHVTHKFLTHETIGQYYH